MGESPSSVPLPLDTQRKVPEEKNKIAKEAESRRERNSSGILALIHNEHENWFKTYLQTISWSRVMQLKIQDTQETLKECMAK